MVDAGLYIQDDWKVRPNFTLSGGLRFETQSGIHDHADWAPRLGFAWGIGGGGKNAPKTVLRGGFGLFYDRFTEDLILNADRQNGVVQQQVPCAESPTFFHDLRRRRARFPSTTAVDLPDQFRTAAPYIMQTAFSLERQVTKIANLTVTYLNARGVHQFLSLNANAPPPGTPYSSGPPPDPERHGPIYQYVSDGVFRQNQLITNFNVRAGSKLSLFGYYSLNYANSDTSGASGFPSDQYNMGADYGRASFDIRHRVFFGGTVGLPRGFRLSPFMIFNSGSPYNVTVGQDLSNDSLFNDRPAFGTNPSARVRFRRPRPAQLRDSDHGFHTPIPINYLTGPNHFTLNLRLAKTFGFGPEVGGKNSGHNRAAAPAGGARRRRRGRWRWRWRRFWTTGPGGWRTGSRRRLGATA